MSSIERGDCYTQFFKGTLCSVWFCKELAVFRRKVYPAFGFPKYKPFCEKHK